MDGLQKRLERIADIALQHGTKVLSVNKLSVSLEDCMSYKGKVIVREVRISTYTKLYNYLGY